MLNTKYYKYKNNNNHNKNNTIILKKIMFFMFLGSVLGGAIIFFIKDDNLQKLNQFIDTFFATEQDQTLTYWYFLEQLIKEGKYLVFIWFLAFIPFGSLFIYLIIFGKGLFLSFTTALVFNSYYFKGIKYILSYSIKSLPIIILIFYISYKSLNYYENKKTISISNYSKYILICMAINILFVIFLK